MATVRSTPPGSPSADVGRARNTEPQQRPKPQQRATVSRRPARMAGLPRCTEALKCGGGTGRQQRLADLVGLLPAVPRGAPVRRRGVLGTPGAQALIDGLVDLERHSYRGPHASRRHCAADCGRDCAPASGCQCRPDGAHTSGDKQHGRDSMHDSVEPLLTRHPSSPVRCTTKALKRVEHHENDHGRHAGAVNALDEISDPLHASSVALHGPLDKRRYHLEVPSFFTSLHRATIVCTSRRGGSTSRFSPSPSVSVTCQFQSHVNGRLRRHSHMSATHPAAPTMAAHQLTISTFHPGGAKCTVTTCPLADAGSSTLSR